MYDMHQGSHVGDIANSNQTCSYKGLQLSIQLVPRPDQCLCGMTPGKRHISRLQRKPAPFENVMARTRKAIEVQLDCAIVLPDLSIYCL